MKNSPQLAWPCRVQWIVITLLPRCCAPVQLSPVGNGISYSVYTPFPTASIFFWYTPLWNSVFQHQNLRTALFFTARPLCLVPAAPDHQGLFTLSVRLQVNPLRAATCGHCPNVNCPLQVNLSGSGPSRSLGDLGFHTETRLPSSCNYWQTVVSSWVLNTAVRKSRL